MRCRTKGIRCQYPVNTPKSRGPRNQESGEAPNELCARASSPIGGSRIVDSQQEAGSDGDVVLDSEPLPFDPESNAGGDYRDWNDLDMAFTDFLNPQTNGETFQYPSPSSSSSVQNSTPWIDQTTQQQQAIFSPKTSIPRTPASNIRSLIGRPKMSTSSQRVANLILHTLKSYPLMMLRHKTLPPFIHPLSMSLEVENDNMETLNNCFNLVHIISSGIRGNRKLFWRNVRQECEHIYAEVC